MTTPTDTFPSVALQRAFGEVRREALKHPVTVTHRGKEDLVLLSRESFAELARLAEIARKLPTALRADELAPDELEAVLNSRVPNEYATLDEDFVPGKDDTGTVAASDGSGDPDEGARTDAA